MIRFISPALLTAWLLSMGSGFAWAELTTFSKEIKAEGARHLVFELKVGAAELHIGSHNGPPMVNLDIEHDVDSQPTIDLDYSGKEAHLVLRSDNDEGFSFSIFGNKNGDNGDSFNANWNISISRDLPVQLTVEFGLGSGSADFGGLDLEELTFATGLSDVELLFSEPLKGKLRVIELASGLGSMEVRGLSNIKADKMAFAGGLGSAMLEFGGEFRRNMDVELEVGMGSLVLKVPKGLGVKIRHDDSFLSNHEFDRLERTSSDTWYSSDWRENEGNLFFLMSVGMGSVELEWIDPE